MNFDVIVQEGVERNNPKIR